MYSNRYNTMQCLQPSYNAYLVLGFLTLCVTETFCLTYSPNYMEFLKNVTLLFAKNCSRDRLHSFGRSQGQLYTQKQVYGQCED